jgi:putative copper resistance protein D
MLMTLHFVAAGYLFCWVLIGPDPGPPRPGYPLRLLVLLVTISAHAFFAVAIMASSTVLAQDWFASIGLTNTQALLDDQQAGGGIAWAIAEVPTLLLVLAVAYLWSRSEDRAAQRSDRQADRDGDAELNAYNAYLARLSAHDKQRSGPEV